MQIRKALFGMELNSLNSLNASNDSLFEDPTIDNSVKEQAKALIAESQNEIQNRQFNSRDLVLYQLGVAQKVQDLLKNGKLNYSESLTGDPQPNGFGYYSKYNNDFPVMVNNTVKTVAGTPTATTEATPEAQPIQTTIRPYAYFKPTEGFNFYTTEGQNQQSKTKSFAKELYGQLTKFLGKGYSSESNVFQGISEDAIPELSIYATKLNQIAQKANITDQDTQTLADIVSKLNNADLSSGFETYFDVQNGIIGGGAAARTQAEAAAREAAAKEAGEYADYLGGTLSDGKKLYIQMDPTKEDYRRATIIDGTTKTSYDLGNQADVDKLNDLGMWQGITQLIKEFNKQFAPKDYTGYGLGHVTDFSNYFTDEDPNNREIVSINWDDYPDLNFDDQLFIPFDKLFPDWETRKARFRFKGNADASLNGVDLSNQYGDLNGLDSSVELPVVKKEDWVSLQQILNDNNSVKKLFEGNNYTIDKMAEFLRLALCLKDSDNGNYTNEQLKQAFPNYNISLSEGKPMVAANVLSILKAHPDEFKKLLAYTIKVSPDVKDRKTLIKVYKSLTETPAGKQGMIIKLSSGDEILSAWDLPKPANKTEEFNYKTGNSSGNFVNEFLGGRNQELNDKMWEKQSQEGFHWGTEDTLRTISMLSDLGAGISSNVVGWGTLGAVGLGLVSTGLEAVADKIDPNVSSGELWRNVGINSGLTIAGAIPDVKLLTTGSKAAKFIAGLVKRGMQVAAIAGISGLARQNVERIIEFADNPEKREWTKEDMRILFNDLTTVGRALLSHHSSKKIKEVSNSVTNPNERVFRTKGPDNKPKDVKLTEAQFNQIVEAGNKGGTKAANEEFIKIVGKDNVAEDAQFPADFGSNWFTRNAIYKPARFIGKITPGHQTQTSFSSYKLPLNEDLVSIRNMDASVKGGNFAVPYSTWDKWKGFEWNYNAPKWWTNLFNPKIVSNTKPTYIKSNKISNIKANAPKDASIIDNLSVNGKKAFKINDELYIIQDKSGGKLLHLQEYVKKHE